MTLYNPDTGDWVIRTAETNMGDFVADAYRYRTGADIALVNSGGIRDSIPAGDVTRKAFMDVNPWNNEMCVINATGQQILDALEHGARLYPEACGGFLQVSGITYQIDAWKESPVVLDETSNFSYIDTTKERRVTNVKVNGVEIDPDKTYTVAGTCYMLKNGGDGFTMFADSTVVKSEGLSVDAETLMEYFSEDLNGIITAEQYGNLLGDGRISIYTNQSDVPVEEPTENPTENPTEQEEPTKPLATEVPTKATTNTESTTSTTANVPYTGDTTTTTLWFAIVAISLTTTIATFLKRKKSDNR